jgi:hypothetical protein
MRNAMISGRRIVSGSQKMEQGVVGQQLEKDIRWARARLFLPKAKGKAETA